MKKIYSIVFLSAFISLNTMGQDLSLLAGHWSIPCYSKIENPEDIVCSEGMRTDHSTFYYDPETGKGQLHKQEDGSDVYALIEAKEEQGRLLFSKQAADGKVMKGKIIQLNAKELHVEYTDGGFIHFYYRLNTSKASAPEASKRLSAAIQLLNRKWSIYCSAPIDKKEEMECMDAAGGLNGKPHNLFEINATTGFGERERSTMDIERMMVRLYEQEGKLLLSTVYQGGVERIGEVILLDADKLEVKYDELGEVWYYSGIQ